jgi:hypothetical protein
VQETTLRVLDVWRQMQKHSPDEMTRELVNIGAGDRWRVASLLLFPSILKYNFAPICAFHLKRGSFRTDIAFRAIIATLSTAYCSTLRTQAIVRLGNQVRLRRDVQSKMANLKLAQCSRSLVSEEFSLTPDGKRMPMTTSS